MKGSIRRPGLDSFSKYKERFIDTRKVQGVPEDVLMGTDPNRMMPVPLIDHLLIVVSGGPGEKSMLIPVWAASKKVISREIVLPSNWASLLEHARGEKGGGDVWPP
jgi:hypothetical protein